MPLTTDEKVLALSEDLLAAFTKLFGEHPGFRPVHAKGTLLSGTFAPTAAAKSLSSAQHFDQPSTPVLVRFSNFTGLPLIPDTDPNANPRGMAVRFMLGDHVHTDIVSHSVNGFPARTGQEFLEFLLALAASDPANLAGSPLEAFLGSHPAALKFVQAPNLLPSSFARESYFGLTALKFINAEGVSRFGRYSLLPEAGNDHLDAVTGKAKDANYLFTEIAERVAKEPVRFHLTLQLAENGDVVDDTTIAWPAEREVVDLGTLELTAPVANDAAEQKHIIFDPIPRLEGIEPSDDPLLELRAAIYLISGRRRRAA